MSQVSSNAAHLAVDGDRLSISDLVQAADNRSGLQVTAADGLQEKMQRSVDLVHQAVDESQSVYGVTTGFGGMAGVPIPQDQASASQNNLLAFLATGAGDCIDPRHVRAAMLLRANVLAQGCSGVRYELVRRLIQFLNANAIPIVRELGSIGASGDLVPLATLARAITGQSDRVRIQYDGRDVSSGFVLTQLGLDPLVLHPKEGLALVNGTSFSAGVAANAVDQSTKLMALTLGVQAMMLQALMVQQEPFDEFVHLKKPHPGQIWTARMMRQLCSEGGAPSGHKPLHVQDRYSLRCLPQYMGSIVEGMGRVTQVVETEMNSVSDNPLVDVEAGRFCQSGNFLGQYLGIAMDDLRRFLGLMAKHLDVQIATLMAPEFSGGLPPSLQGNPALPYNMGFKGLQITGNSIMPMLTYYGNPVVEHFPTHAEQFNQNINGLSWGSANLAWKSVELFQQYLAVSTLMSIQALDLRAQALHGHYDGRVMTGSSLSSLYETVCDIVGCVPGSHRPFVFDDSDRWLEQDLTVLGDAIAQGDFVVDTMSFVLESFRESFVSDSP